MKKLFILIVVSCFFPVLSWAAEALKFPPRFPFYASDTDNSAVSMDCKGSPPYNNISCEFTQISIIKPSAEEIEKNRSAMLADIKKMKDSDFQKTKKEFIIKESDKKKMDIKAEKLGAVQKASHLRRKPLLEELEKVSNKDDLEKVMLKILEDENRTCKIWVNTYKNDFQKIEAHKWASTVTGVGFCNRVDFSTLENDPKSPDLFWTYTVSSVSCDKNSEMCKNCAEELNKPLIYSWQHDDQLYFDCEFIKFGL